MSGQLAPRPVDILLGLAHARKYYDAIRPTHPAGAFKMTAAMWTDILSRLKRLLHLVRTGREVPGSYYKYMRYIPWDCGGCPASGLTTCPVKDGERNLCLPGIPRLWLNMRSGNLSVGLEEARDVPKQFLKFADEAKDTDRSNPEPSEEPTREQRSRNGDPQ
jgi:hypothetical protein